MKNRIIKLFMGKFSAPITSWVVGALAAYLVSLLATTPEWAQTLLGGFMEAISGGQFTEINLVSLTAVLTPIIASIIQAGIHYAKTGSIQDLQEVVGADADGHIGPKTLKAAATHNSK